MELSGETIGIGVGIIGAILGTWIQTRLVIAKLEVKVDTMWAFQMRRSISESVQKGVATMNSPVKVTPEAKAWFETLRAELQAFYAKLGRKLTAHEMALEIERRFGDRMLKEVCIPQGLYEGVCLLIAMEVAKEAPKKTD